MSHYWQPSRNRIKIKIKIIKLRTNKFKIFSIIENLKESFVVDSRIVGANIGVIKPMIPDQVQKEQIGSIIVVSRQLRYLLQFTVRDLNQHALSHALTAA